MSCSTPVLHPHQRVRLELLAVAVLSLIVGGCQPAMNPQLPTVVVQLGSNTLTLEVADNPKSRALGLMNRIAISHDGMMFVYDHPGRRCFWMRDTRFDLDISFFGDDGQLLATQTARAGTDDQHCVDAARYVIETNPGVVESGESLDVELRL